MNSASTAPGITGNYSLKNDNISADQQAYFEALTPKSLEKQAAIEAADTLSFDDFLSHYLEQ